MPSIQIKNVPEEVHRALQGRARASGQSLQEFLLGQLQAIADREVMEEIFERARKRRIDAAPEEVVKIIREDRESH